MYARAKAAGRETKQTAAAADIQKRPAVKPLHFEHLLQRLFRQRDPLIAEHPQKPRPVSSELKPLASADFDLVLIDGACHLRSRITGKEDALSGGQVNNRDGACGRELVYGSTGAGTGLEAVVIADDDSAWYHPWPEEFERRQRRLKEIDVDVSKTEGPVDRLAETVRNPPDVCIDPRGILGKPRFHFRQRARERARTPMRTIERTGI